MANCNEATYGMLLSLYSGRASTEARYFTANKRGIGEPERAGGWRPFSFILVPDNQKIGLDDVVDQRLSVGA